MIRSKVAVAAFSLLFAASIVHAAGKTKGGRAALIAEAEVAVKVLMKDPGSAQFQIDLAENGTVCGSFNAKNSFGGYVGFQRFMYVQTAEPGEKLMIAETHPDAAEPGKISRGQLGSIMVPKMCDMLIEDAHEKKTKK